MTNGKKPETAWIPPQDKTTSKVEDKKPKRKRLLSPQNSSSSPVVIDGKIQISGIRDLLAPQPKGSKTVNLRLAGVWLEVWDSLKKRHPKKTDTEILRIGLAAVVALDAPDESGQKPEVLITFIKNGEKVTQSLTSFLGADL